MFRTFCAKYLLNERFTVQFIERLRSSARLREICGFGDTVPSKSTFSRFFQLLSGQRGLLEDAIAQLTGQLKLNLPDVGESIAVDSTDIEAYSNPNRESPIDQDATWGHRTTKAKSSKDAKDTEPFSGYKMHALNDAVHGVPLTCIMLPANVHDSKLLPELVKKAQELYPWLRPDHLLGDRGYDSQANHKFLLGRGITPIIHMRKSSGKSKLLDDRYDVRGRPVCLDLKTPMEYVLTDPETGKHLFRCPPDGCALKSRSSGLIRYCDPRDPHWEDYRDNPRVIGLVARASPEWKKLYAGRQIIERMFGSMKRSRILNKHQYTTRAKIETHMALSTLTYLATMLTRVSTGDLKRIRHMRIGVA